MNVLLGYDGSLHADIALDDLRRAGLPANARAVVLAAIEHTSPADRYGQAARARLQDYFPRWDVQLETPAGDAASLILRKASAWPADLIALGTHGRSGLARALLGSVSLKIAREATCSVRIGRHRTGDGPIRLIVATDGSPESDAAVDVVCSRSWPDGTEAKVVAVHSVLVPANSERIAIGDRLYDQINEDEHLRLRHVSNDAALRIRSAGLVVMPLVEEGDPKRILAREAKNWNADTLFMGARGLGRVERLLMGSVSSSCITHALCTVEIIHHH
jgi:nucleotide-binding universal stress UspA family protein